MIPKSASIAPWLTLLLLTSAHAAPVTLGLRPCEAGESWSVSMAIEEDWSADDLDDFEGFIAGRINPVQGFADGLALRGKSAASEGRTLGEYWMARALWKQGLLHLAHQGFAALAAKPLKKDRASIQAAALGCLAQIHLQMPSLGIPAEVAERLPDYPSSQPLWDVAMLELRNELAKDNFSRSRADGYLKMLSLSGSQVHLARAMVEQRESHHRAAIEAFKAYFAANRTVRPLEAKLEDHARVMYARALFSNGQYDAAIEQYKLVSRNSNELANSLSELAWAYLQAGRYTEAIGTAITLQAGGLRHTFTPEAPMVMAMALNEICQYPESVRAINSFRRTYEKPFRWLVAHQKDEAASFYEGALAYIKKSGNVSRVIASEWVRSPVFLSSQAELNLLVDERANGGKIPAAGIAQQNAQIAEILKFIDGFKSRFEFALKERKNEDDDLPMQITHDLKLLRRKLVTYYRLRKSAPIWRGMIAHQSKQAPAIRSERVAAIHRDLAQRTTRMTTQLEEIAENLQLVEVEIYNGASQDIIWQNAHPEYKELAKKINDDAVKSTREKVWDWGRVTASNSEAEDGATEIWEDELGSFKADLVDNCSSKDKYLALKFGKK